MSAPGRYRRPRGTFTAHPWFGEDRRAADPVSQLARSLFGLCREAADPYELAAHLEAIGFNRYRVTREFGLANTFALAKRLFELTPRKPALRLKGYTPVALTWLRQLTLLGGILVTLGLQTRGSQADWGVLIFLITWSVVGSRFVDLGAGALKAPQRRGLLSLLVLSGLLGLLGFWLAAPPTLAGALVGGLWWGLTVTLWLEQTAGELNLKSLLPVAIAFLGLLPYPLELALGILFFVTLYLLLPQLGIPDRQVWRYLRRNWPFTLLLLTYGLALGALFVQLFRSFPAGLLAGGAVMILTLFAAEWGLLWVRRSLTASLWRAQGSEDYAQSTAILRALAPQLLIFGLAAAALFWLPFSDLFYGDLLSRFGLFGLSLALALILLSLDNVLIPAALLGSAALALLWGLPLVWVLPALCVTLAAGVIFHVRRVESYGIYLL